MERLTRWILLVSGCFFLCSCSGPEQEKIVTDYRFDVSKWEGWTVSYHRDNFYYFIEIGKDTVRNPRIFYSPKTKTYLIGFRDAGDYSKVLLTDEIWARIYPTIPIDTLKNRIRWIESNHILDIVCDSTSVSIETQYTHIDGDVSNGAVPKFRIFTTYP